MVWRLYLISGNKFHLFYIFGFRNINGRCLEYIANVYFSPGIPGAFLLAVKWGVILLNVLTEPNMMLH